MLTGWGFSEELANQRIYLQETYNAVGSGVQSLFEVLSYGEPVARESDVRDSRKKPRMNEMSCRRST